MHAVGNAFGHPLAVEYISYATGKELFADIGDGVIFIIFVALAGMVSQRW